MQIPLKAGPYHNQSPLTVLPYCEIRRPPQQCAGRFFYSEVRMQLTHEAERRWVLMLIQLEQTRIAHLAAA